MSNTLNIPTRICTNRRPASPGPFFRTTSVSGKFNAAVVVPSGWTSSSRLWMYRPLNRVPGRHLPVHPENVLAPRDIARRL